MARTETVTSLTMHKREYNLKSGYTPDSVASIGTVISTTFVYPDGRIVKQATYSTVFFCILVSRQDAARILNGARHNLYKHESIERRVIS